MDYVEKPLVRARVPYNPALVTGLTWISRFRIKTVATTAQMFAWGKLMPYWTTRYMCCKKMQRIFSLNAAAGSRTGKNI